MEARSQLKPALWGAVAGVENAQARLVEMASSWDRERFTFDAIHRTHGVLCLERRRHTVPTPQIRDALRIQSVCSSSEIHALTPPNCVHFLFEICALPTQICGCLPERNAGELAAHTCHARFPSPARTSAGIHARGGSSTSRTDLPLPPGSSRRLPLLVGSFRTLAG